MFFLFLQAKHLDNSLALQGFSLAQLRQRPKNAVHWDVESKHLAMFVELVLKNTKTLDKMFLVLDDRYRTFKKMIRTLSHNNKVSIAFLDATSAFSDATSGE